MGDLFVWVVEFVAQIWKSDSDLRDRSVLGEARIDQKNRRFVAWMCGGTIVLLLVVGLIWWLC